MRVNLIGEAHIENLDNFKFDLLYNFFSFSLSAEIINEYVINFTEEQIERFKTSILSFYSVINDLIDPDEDNILFIESYSNKKTIDKMLSQRGLDPSLFSKKYFLDKPNYKGKDPRLREYDWLEIMLNELSGVRDAAVYIIGGLHHWRPESLVSYKYLPRMLGRHDLVVVPYMMNDLINDLQQDYIMFKKELLQKIV